VNVLGNKIKERGLLEKAGRLAGKAVDFVTLGATRGFLTAFIPGNVGNKVLNSIELQTALKKNLSKLDKINKIKEGETFLNKAADFLRDTVGE